jgi:hypothetical protein
MDCRRQTHRIEQLDNSENGVRCTGRSKWGSMSISKCISSLRVFLILFALPIAAWANSTSFQSSGGQITSNGSVLTLNSSILTGVTGMFGGPVTGNLGRISFTTGSLLTGSLAAGGTFAAGGSFTLTGNGTNGLPMGVVFTGTFSGPTIWTATFMSGFGPNHQGAWFYSLSGNVSGVLSGGEHLSAKVTFFTNDVPNGQQFSDFANLNRGTGNVLVPEPGSLALTATGLMGLAFLVRRKWLSPRANQN